MRIYTRVFFRKWWPIPRNMSLSTTTTISTSDIPYALYFIVPLFAIAIAPFALAHHTKHALQHAHDRRVLSIPSPAWSQHCRRARTTKNRVLGAYLSIAALALLAALGGAFGLAQVHGASAIVGLHVTQVIFVSLLRFQSTYDIFVYSCRRLNHP